MAHKKNNTNLTELLLQCMTQPDPILSMLEWLCTQLMEAEVDHQLVAEKSERADSQSGYRSGYRPRRLDTRRGTMYLMVPKVRQGGYIPFFVTERKRSEAALIQVVQEAFVQGVFTRKMEKLAQSFGIESLSRSQVNEMTKGLNEQVNEFRNRPLSNTVYPVLRVDALYEKVRVDGRIVSMAVLIVCGVDENGRTDIIAIEPIAEESRNSYVVLFQDLKARGLATPKLVVSDAYPGLVAAIQESFPGAFWQLCKVHFTRNILTYVPQKEKKAFAAVLKEIWMASTAALARKRAYDVMDAYAKRFPKAVQYLENGLEDSMTFYAFPKLDARKISSSNVIERLNREIRRRTSVVEIFPNESSYIQLVTTYLMEYAEDWSVSRAYLSQESIAATLLIAA